MIDLQCPRCGGSGTLHVALEQIPPYWQRLLRRLAGGEWLASADLPLNSSALHSTRRQALIGLQHMGLIETRQGGTGMRLQYWNRITAAGKELLG